MAGRSSVLKKSAWGIPDAEQGMTRNKWGQNLMAALIKDFIHSNSLNNYSSSDPTETCLMSATSKSCSETSREVPTTFVDMKCQAEHSNHTFVPKMQMRGEGGISSGYRITICCHQLLLINLLHVKSVLYLLGKINLLSSSTSSLPQNRNNNTTKKVFF